MKATGKSLLVDWWIVDLPYHGSPPPCKSTTAWGCGFCYSVFF